MDWPVEVIPDEDFLYHRIHQTFIRSNEIYAAAFVNRPKGSLSMSVDWAKYAMPEDTKARAKKPSENAIVRFVAGEVRTVPGQKVEHSPNLSENNRAHADIIGEKTAEVRTLLSRICLTMIPLEQGAHQPQPSSPLKQA